MRFISRSLSYVGDQPPSSPLAPFRNTYLRISVSKHCCPMCALLISLLLCPHTPSISGPLSHKCKIILSQHQYIYPTPLPRFLLERLAIELLSAMEGLRRLEVVLVGQARQDRRLGERRGSPVKGDRAISESESEGQEMVQRTQDRRALDDVLRNRAYNKVESKTR